MQSDGTVGANKRFRQVRALQEKQMSCITLLSIHSAVKYAPTGETFLAFNAMFHPPYVVFSRFFLFLGNIFLGLNVFENFTNFRPFGKRH